MVEVKTDHIPSCIEPFARSIFCLSFIVPIYLQYFVLFKSLSFVTKQTFPTFGFETNGLSSRKEKFQRHINNWGILRWGMSKILEHGAQGSVKTNIIQFGRTFERFHHSKGGHLLLRPGTNTIKLILLKFNCRKIMARFWCIILDTKWVCICKFAPSRWKCSNP